MKPMHRWGRLMRRAFSATLATLCLAALPTAATAQAGAWPNKPVRILVGYPAGGLADLMARNVAQLVTESTGQQFIVENRPGANGNLAAEAITRLPADGYTLCLCSTVIESVNPFLYAKMSFDPQADVVPVAATGRIQLFLVGKQELKAANVQEFVAQAKAARAPYSYGSAGPGSSPHLVAELFKRSAGFEATHIPYKGAAPAMQDLLGGQFEFFFDPGLSPPHVRAGKLKLLAVASSSRSPLFPETPTLGELGFKGLDYDTWFGFYARGGTPAAIVARINEETNKALANAGLKSRYREVGADAVPMSPAEFKAIAQRERTVFGQLIREQGIKSE